MQLAFSSSFLLVALLFAIAQVEASPVMRSRTVTLPLKRLPQQIGVHPTVLLQQHINRSHRRHARMVGVGGPSTTELEKRLQKRLNLAKPPKYDKRYNRSGARTHLSLISMETGAKIVTRMGKRSIRAAIGGDNLKATPDQGFPKAALDAANAGDLTKANKPTAPNSIGLDVEQVYYLPANDVGYIATIQAGTPPRDFSVLMDSGSADFWIGGEGCQSQSGGDCGNHVFLGQQSSTTFRDSGKVFQVTYGSGQVQGNIVSDNLNIAGLALVKHVFGVALVESQDFSGNATKFDGLMGLAQSTLSNQRVLTPVESLAKQGLISEAITSYKISRVSDGLNDGEITFGGLDQSKFDPSTLVTFQNINQNGFWEGDVTVSVDSQDLGLQGRTAILDTGTTLIIAPPADADAVHAKIPGTKTDGQGGFVIPCTNTAVVSLTFGGQAFDINPIDLLFAPVDPNNLQGDCLSGITSGQIGGPQQWLVGDVFLKNAYFSHNVNKNQISLAKLV
ncbi:acid protease [Thelephora ganbajun]|uniref:Acid protease n=1 Tax=Thelephora ganbajun TaxID=370292 RepID=A0ACB6ZGV7_THEGA|nr:acid protease [Thelephora ganbajun]